MIPALFGLLAVLGSACAYERYFSIGHGQFIRTRLDPIVAPGKVSSHVHTVAGTSNFLATESFADARDGECTTSFIQDDKSSYWAPQLYYKWKNGTYSAIPGDGLVTYWKYASDTDTPEFAVVPDDFRMLAGDVTRDHFDPNEPSHQAISFECIGDGYDYKLPYIPNDIECKWIRPQAFFPNCWNGKDSYLPDNSHVIYPTGNFESGACPAGFVRIPSLFMEAYYKVPENMGSEYEWYPGCLVLANGDNHGYSFHSDWLNGWPSGMLVDAYKTCIDQLQGSVDGCSVFEASRDEDKAWHCQPKGEVVAEAVGVSAPLAQLPGNNPEFNSSRDSPDYPKRLFADYTESAHIIPVNSKGAGTCTHFKCADYPADP